MPSRIPYNHLTTALQPPCRWLTTAPYSTTTASAAMLTPRCTPAGCCTVYRHHGGPAFCGGCCGQPGCRATVGDGTMPPRKSQQQVFVPGPSSQGTLEMETPLVPGDGTSHQPTALDKMIAFCDLAGCPVASGPSAGSAYDGFRRYMRPLVTPISRVARRYQKGDRF